MTLLEIQGIPNSEKETAEDLKEKVVKVLQYANETITSDDVDITHRLGSQKKSANNPNESKIKTYSPVV